jgi:hypothetical protein
MPPAKNRWNSAQHLGFALSHLADFQDCADPTCDDCLESSLPEVCFHYKSLGFLYFGEGKFVESFETLEEYLSWALKLEDFEDERYPKDREAEGQ